MDHPSQDPPNRCGESLHTKKPLETAAQLRYTSKTLHVREADAMRRDVRAGRRSTIGNRVGVKSVSRVQIPDSPPVNSKAGLRACFVFTPRGGVAEWLNAAVSKTVSPVLPVTRVRIPPPPPFSVPIYSRIQAPFSLFTLALVSSLTQSVARSPFLPQRCRQYDIIPPCATEFASANFDNFRVSPVQLFVTIC